MREALSVYLVAELYDNVDVPAELEQRLPSGAGSSLRARRPVRCTRSATDAVNRVLDAPRVQQLWINASSLAQQKLVNVLEDKTGPRDLDGRRRGDARSQGAGSRRRAGSWPVHLPPLDRIPPDTGVITVMRSERAGRGAVRREGAASAEHRAPRCSCSVLYAPPWYLAAPATGAGRCATSGGRWCSSGSSCSSRAGSPASYAVDALTQPQSHEAGERTWLIGSSILGQIGAAAILYGAVIVLGAVLAGPTARATAVRQRLAVALERAARASAWAVVAGAFLLLVVWGPTEALRTLVGHRGCSARWSPRAWRALLRQIARHDAGATRDGDPAPAGPAAGAT